MSQKRASETHLGVEVGKGFVAKLVGAVFGFVGTIIFARLLGPTDFGGFYLLLSIVKVAKRPIDGISAATRKRFAEVDSLRNELIGTQFLSTIGLIMILILVSYPIRNTLQNYTGLDNPIFLMAILLTAIAAFGSFQDFLTSIGQIGIQTWIDTARSILTFSAQLVFVFVGFGATGMAYGLSFGTIILVPVTHYYLKVLPIMPSHETVRSVWSFARYSIPSSFVGKAYDRFDILLLGLLSTQAVAGHYEVAFKLTLPTMFIAGLAGSGLMARVSEFESKGQIPTADITNTLSFASLFAIPCLAGAIAISKAVVVTLYGPAFAPAAILLIGLALYRVIQTQTNVFIDIIEGLDMPEWDFRISSVALIVNIILGILLFLEFGPIGVVLATVIAEITRYITLRRLIITETDARLISKPLLKQIIAASAMFLFVDRVQEIIAIRSWIELSLLIVIGGVIYFGLLLIISSRFRVTIRDIIQQFLHSYNLN